MKTQFESLSNLIKDALFFLTIKKFRFIMKFNFLFSFDTKGQVTSDTEQILASWFSQGHSRRQSGHIPFHQSVSSHLIILQLKLAFWYLHVLCICEVWSLWPHPTKTLPCPCHMSISGHYHRSSEHLEPHNHGHYRSGNRNCIMECEVKI